MRNFIKKMVIGAVVALALSQPGVASATDLVLVANPSVGDLGSVSSQDLKNLYLGKVTTISGKDVKLVGLEDGNPNQGKFLTDILGMSSEELKNYWIQESLKGGGQPPKAVESPASSVQFVQRRPGTVGYVDKKTADGSGLKVIAISQ